MKKIFIFPTIDQAKGFILREPRHPVFIGGEGMAEIAAAVIRAVKAKKPQLVVLCGLAQSDDAQLPAGTVVEVVTQRVAGMPGRYETTAPDTGLPLAAGVTVSSPEAGMAGLTAGCGAEAGTAGLTTGCGAEAGTSGLTAGCSAAGGGAEKRANAQNAEQGDGDNEEDAEESLPQVINTEGAAFFAVCEALGVAGCEIRAVTGQTGVEAPVADSERAIENLTEILIQTFRNDE